MNNKGLLKQYVGTGIGIPRYQFNKLNNNLKKTYLYNIRISLEDNPYNLEYYYGELSEKEQFDLVNRRGYIIQYIDNPSERVQLAAVKDSAGSIYYIDNPSEEVQMIAVKHDGHFLNYIIQKGIDPSEDVKLAALRQNRSASIFIDDVEEKLRLIKKI